MRIDPPPFPTDDKLWRYRSSNQIRYDFRVYKCWLPELQIIYFIEGSVDHFD